LIPSRASASISSAVTGGFISSVSAERMIRRQWRSRSGADPPNARAPSNTAFATQAAFVSESMIGVGPSCHRPS